MDFLAAQPTRRAFLALGAGTALAAAVSSTGTAHAAVAPADGITGRLRGLEQEHSARLGVFARNLTTGETVRYRADERFPVCSLWKPLAVAAVLRDFDQNGEFLWKRVRYSQADLLPGSQITSLPENLAGGLSVQDLCDAALRFSDNTAGNLLLRQIGGPAAVTGFCRSVGDGTTRLDRWEPEVNSAEPWRAEDTTSPHAIAQTYAKLLAGDALAESDRNWLAGWMMENETDMARLRAGLPEGWHLAGKTGEGGYGTNHNVGVTWSRPQGDPVVLSVLTTKGEAGARPDDALIAATAALLVAEVV